MATVRSSSVWRSPPPRRTCTRRIWDLPYAASASMTGSGKAEKGSCRVGGSHSTAPFLALADLASARVGGRAVSTNDDFFASKANLVKAEPPIFVPGKYTTRGKWMDGWESRRRRTPGHDWCIIALGIRGVVHGVNVNTQFFTGNFPSHCSIDALDVTTV